LDKQYQEEPRQEDIDAYLEALENEVSVPACSKSKEAPPQPTPSIEARGSDAHDLLWFMLVVGIGLFAWLVSRIFY
jgi:hypothetical protein